MFPTPEEKEGAPVIILYSIYSPVVINHLLVIDLLSEHQDTVCVLRGIQDPLPVSGELLTPKGRLQGQKSENEPKDFAPRDRLPLFLGTP